MHKIILTIKDQSRLGFVLELLRGLEYVDVEQEEEKGLSVEHKQILDERLAKHQAHREEGSSWEDIKKRLLS